MTLTRATALSSSDQRRSDDTPNVPLQPTSDGASVEASCGTPITRPSHRSPFRLRVTKQRLRYPPRPATRAITDVVAAIGWLNSSRATTRERVCDYPEEEGQGAVKLLLLPLGLIGGLVLVVVANRVESLAVGVFLASVALVGGIVVVWLSKQITAWGTADIVALSPTTRPERTYRLAVIVLGLGLVLRAAQTLLARLGFGAWVGLGP